MSVARNDSSLEREALNDSSTSAPRAYLAVVEEGARRYLAHLRALLGRSSRAPRELALREVARPLAQGLEQVLRTRRLAPGEIQIPEAPFTRGGGHPELTNPWAVGLGHPSAPVLAVGPEPRYALDHVEFLLEGLLLQALWLADAGVEVAAAAVGCPPWSQLPFQRYPNDFYREPTRSTWGRLATLLAHAWGEDTRALLQPKGVADNPAPHLLEDVYLLDLSTVPADWKQAAVTPLSEREAFLGELLASMPDARLLLLHGQPEEPGWEDVQLRLAARFLGFPLEELKACLQTERPTRTREELRWFFPGDRGVLLTVSFQRPMPEGYGERAAELIRLLLPERPLPP